MDGREPRSQDPTTRRPTTDDDADDADAAARSSAPSFGPGGIDAFDSLFVRHRIRDGATDAVRDLLADWTTERPDADSRTLLPVGGVSLVTLFLDERDDAEGEDLLWYLEVADDDADEWDDPDRTIRTSSPLFDEGLGELLVEAATIHADGVGGRQLVTHATHPRRQQRYGEMCDRSLYAPVAGDELPIDVVEKTVRLRAGITSWLAGRVVALGNWIERSNRVSERIRKQTDTLEEEAMYTESLLLEPVDGGQSIRYYMETESMERLYDAYESTNNLGARASDWVMRRIFEDPEEFVEYPLETDCEVLLHAVNSERP